MYINSGFHNSNVDIKSINPIAIRPIKKGEEILGDYGSNFKTPPKNFI
jgi:SET domain-containing protein